MTSAPGPSGSGGVAAIERVDERDDPRAVTEQDLDPDLVEQLADAVQDLGRVDRVPPGVLDRLVPGAGAGGLEHRVARSAPRPRGG